MLLQWLGYSYGNSHVCPDGLFANMHASVAYGLSQPYTCRYEQRTDGMRVCIPPARVLLLFSGGLDSTTLAAMADRSLPDGEPIDLVNVCFDGGRSPDRVASLDALEELATLAPARPWRLILVDATLADVDRHRQRHAACIGCMHHGGTDRGQYLSCRTLGRLLGTLLPE